MALLSRMDRCWWWSARGTGQDRSFRLDEEFRSEQMTVTLVVACVVVLAPDSSVLGGRWCSARWIIVGRGRRKGQDLTKVAKNTRDVSIVERLRDMA
jgi:hypothetical protein